MSEPLSDNPIAQLDAALKANDVQEASNILFGLTMWGDDARLAFVACQECLKSKDNLLRANAIQSLGHMARVFGTLDESMKEIIEKALLDPDDNIRAQADSAAMDVADHLKWKIRGWPPD